MSSLRDALAAGEADTPAGVDLAAVRRRAGALRRRRIAVAAAAVVAVLVVAVPGVALRADRAPTAAPPAPALGCPDRLPQRPADTGPGLDRTLVPVTPTGAIVCAYPLTLGLDSYTDVGPLLGVATLDAAEARAMVDRLDSGPVFTGVYSCAKHPVPSFPFLLRVGGDGRVVSVRADIAGCVILDNGSVLKAPSEQREYLRGLADRAFAPVRCPATLPVTGYSEQPRPPAGTRRLALCAYAGGERVGPGTRELPDVVLTGAEARTAAAALTAAPTRRTDTPCTPTGPGRRLVVVAIAPDQVRRAVATLPKCGPADPLLQSLYDRAAR